jgi:starch synthase
MAKPFSILFTASEIYPFAKTGGLADVAYGLPLALRDLEHDIRVMLPKYGAISERKNRIHEINRLKDIPIQVGEREEPATVKSSSITNPRTKVQAYMTTNYHYYDSKWGVYSDPETGVEYADNDERFIFFTRTIIETCLLLGWFPDIVHCNDWQTSLLAMYMRTMYREQFKNTKIVLTIHNINNQGTFPLKSTFAKTGLSQDVIESVKHKNQFNFLKAGILYADRITTVSETYGQELLNDAKLTNGLNSCLRERKDVFHPILNGIDTTVWDPEKDKLISKRYTADSFDKKEANKEELVEKFGLRYKPGTPVIGIISRLVVLGEGDADIEKALTALAKKYPDKLAVEIKFDDPLAHLIEAGADMYLMPSLFEPCGLNQMYSFAYGTVPIVRATGGLIDTVHEFDETTGKGNGFTFKKYEAADMMNAIRRALSLYKNSKVWETIATNGMKEDYSWARSARKYEEVYRALMA